MIGLRRVDACYPHLEREPFIEGIHRPVASIGDARAGRGQKSGGLDVLVARGPEIFAGALHGIRRLLLPLERQHGDHVQLLVAWKIRRIDDLVVSDGGADVAVGESSPQRADAIQSFAHRAIAVRMHVRFESGAGHFDQQPAQHGRGGNTHRDRGSSTALSADWPLRLAGSNRGSAWPR